MRALVVALALALMAASEASATTWYVRGNRGVDLITSGTFAVPYKHVSPLNGRVQPGDVVDIDSLTASDTTNAEPDSTQTLNRIEPAVGGTSYAATITYQGPAGAAPTDALRTVPSVIISGGKDYITVKNLRIKNGVQIDGTNSNAATGIVVENCWIGNTTPGESGVYFTGAKKCKLSNNKGVFQGGTTGTQAVLRLQSTGVVNCTNCQRSEQDTLQNNVFNLGKFGTGYVQFFITGHSNRLFIQGNRFDADMDAAFNSTDSNNPRGFCVEESYLNSYIGNTFNWKRTLNVGGFGAFKVVQIRSGTHDNLFADNQFNVGGTTDVADFPVVCQLSDAGSADTTTAHLNTWLRNTISIYGSLHSQGMIYGTWKDDVWRDNVFKGVTSSPLEIAGSNSATNVEVNGNTFYSRDSPALRFLAGSTSFGSGVKFARNVFYTRYAYSCSTPLLAISQTGPYTAEYNAFYSTNGPPGSAVKVNQSGFCYSVGASGLWCSTFGHDCASVYADPMLADTSWASFSAIPQLGSSAYNASFPCHPDSAKRDFDQACVYGGTWPNCTTASLSSPYDSLNIYDRPWFHYAGAKAPPDFYPPDSVPSWTLTVADGGGDIDQNGVVTPSRCDSVYSTIILPHGDNGGQYVTARQRIYWTFLVGTNSPLNNSWFDSSDDTNCAASEGHVTVRGWGYAGEVVQAAISRSQLPGGNRYYGAARWRFVDEQGGTSYSSKKTYNDPGCLECPPS